METNTLDANLITEKTSSVEARIASGGKRFANSILDTIALYIIYIAFAFFIGFLGLFSPESPGVIYLIYLIAPAYYLIMEATTGKTLGKMITKTRVVTIDGEKPDFKTALIRTLCRIIPFDAFSFLGSRSVGWHDSIAKSRVIDDN